MATRVVGVVAIFGSLLAGPSLRAEPRGPGASVASPAGAGSLNGAAAALEGLSSTASNSSKAPSSEERATCTVSGTASPDLGIQISDAEKRPLARFGGVAVPLTLSAFPEKNEGMVRVVTNGAGRLRLEGYVSLRSIRLYLNQDVPIIAQHVKLLKGAAADFIGQSGSQMRIAVTTVDPLAETYDTSVPCDALTLEPQPSGEQPWLAPGHARGYLMKQSVLPLFDRPGAGAKPVTSLHLASTSRGLLFFGDRREGDYIHVLYHRDVAIEGWIAARDLEILPRGELIDQSASKYAAPNDKRLAMRADGQLYRAPSDLPLYGRADPKQPPIGTVVKDTELYVLDVVVGWASVLPKQLDVVPIGDRHFWVRASELGL